MYYRFDTMSRIGYGQRHAHARKSKPQRCNDVMTFSIGTVPEAGFNRGNDLSHIFVSDARLPALQQMFEKLVRQIDRRQRMTLKHQ